MRKSTPCSLGVMGKGVGSSGTRWTISTSSTSSSKPEGARESARTLAGDDDGGLLGEGLDAVEDFGGTAALGTMPWMVPVPSRKMGKRSLPEERML
jgi:hypothetical protein